jgi:hypothetical protein
MKLNTFLFLICSILIGLLFIQCPEQGTSGGGGGSGGSSSSTSSYTTSGLYDSTFNNGGSGANSPVDTVALQSNGMLIIGGRFKTYNGNNVPHYIIRLK